MNVPECDIANNPAEADQFFPYSGPCFYPIGTVVYMLRAEIITSDNLCYGLRGSVRRKPSELKAVFETLKKAADPILQEELEQFQELKTQCELAGEEVPKDPLFIKDADDIKRFHKLVVLSWIGLCNITERLSWNEVQSMYADDVVGGTIKS